jgi:hypothetical protein
MSRINPLCMFSAPLFCIGIHPHALSDPEGGGYTQAMLRDDVRAGGGVFQMLRLSIDASSLRP